MRVVFFGRCFVGWNVLQPFLILLLLLLLPLLILLPMGGEEKNTTRYNKETREKKNMQRKNTRALPFASVAVAVKRHLGRRHPLIRPHLAVVGAIQLGLLLLDGGAKRQQL